MGATRDSDKLASLIVHPGRVLWVSSVTGTNGDGRGLAPDQPLATVAGALAYCTANRGDVIYMLPGHAEAIVAAGTLTIDVAGVSIIGLGNGNLRPTWSWTTLTTASCLITAANVLIKNIRCTATIDECVSMIAVSAAGVTFDAVDYFETTSAQAIQFLLTTNAADQLTIKNCFHRQLTAAGSAQKWIQLVGTDDTVIENNKFNILANASTGSHLISGSTAVVGAFIVRNFIQFTGATVTIAINCVTGSTGQVSDNRIFTGTSVATTAVITGDGMSMFENYWADTAAASGLLAPAVDTDT